LTAGAERWSCGKPGSTVTLTDDGGTDHKLVLTEYY
jgi:hypothetical protein